MNKNKIEITWSKASIADAIFSDFPCSEDILDSNCEISDRKLEISPTELVTSF